MARNYILGGMAGTQLQAGKPYFKRIVRIGGQGGINRNAVDNAKHPDSVGFTCDISNDPGTEGAIDFDISSSPWQASGSRTGGELLMVEFPTTMRSVEIALEESWVGEEFDLTDPQNPIKVEDRFKQAPGQGRIRLKVMLTAERSNKFQKTHFFDGEGNQDANSPLAKPIQNGNYIEVMQGETATISSRTKVVFILIQKFASDDILNPTNGFVNGQGQAGVGVVDDAVSILITGVLDHEPTSGGSQAANEPNSLVIEDGGVETRTLRKIWGAADGIG